MESFIKYFEVKNTVSKGKGIFSKIHIPAKTVILEWISEVKTRESILAESGYIPESNNYLQIGKDLFLASTGGTIDYINHSCNPNCGFSIVGHRALLNTLYEIKPGDELTFDYSTTSTDSRQDWNLNCACGDFNCRKVISGFQYLTEEQKKYYLNLGVVPNYLKKI